MQLQVARIGKPHGIRGEVTVQVLTDAPEDRFVPGTEFVVEPASAGPLTVRSAQLFIETEELDEDDDEGWYEHELVGLEARVGSQAVGKVAALNTMPVQDLLVVETPDGKEILIPFVEQIVPEVNVEDGFVLLTPPAGLFEINEEGGAEDPETRGTDSDEDPTVDDAEPEAKA